MQEFCFYYLLFVIYAMMGWIMEIIVCSISENKLVDRGFLIGPYCPIYGVGAITIIFLLQPFLYDPLLVFLFSSFFCAIIEYSTSYIMEKLFNARWWDYSEQLLNLNGRITLKNTIAFGLLGLLLLFFINPFISDLVNKIPDSNLVIITIIIMIAMAIDAITTFIIVYKLKSTWKQIKKDSTEEITRKVKALLKTHPFTKRLINAFPNIHFK